MPTYTNWWLPSEAEAQLLYDNLKYYGLGNFINSLYWTSTENYPYGRAIDMTNGIMYDSAKGTSIRVRAITTFTSNDTIALHSAGRNGGIIFYHAGNTYYEAAPTDASSAAPWSNVMASLGNTNYAVSYGFPNTNNIVAQTGHYFSAAKQALDYAYTTVLIPPSNPTATTPYCSYLVFSWTNNNTTGCDHNMVQTLVNGVWTDYTQVGATVVNSTVIGAPTTTLTMRVAAVDVDGNRFYSDSVQGATLTVTNPTNLVATFENYNQVRLNWTNNSTNGTNLIIHRIHNSVSTEIATLSLTDTTYLDTTVVAGETYSYQVSANCSVYSFWSNNQNVTIPLPLTLTTSKTDITCHNLNNGTITVSSYAGGTAPITFSKDGVTYQSSTSFTGLAAGAYTIYMKDVNNNIYSGGAQTIINPAVLNATLNYANVSTYGGSNGTITISSPTGGFGTYQYSINGGASWQSSGSYTGLGANSYDVQIRDAAHPDCYLVLNATLVLTQPSPINPPTRLVAVLNGKNVDLTWLNSNIVGDNVLVYRTLNGVTSTIATLPVTATSYTDTGVTGGNKYFYYVAVVQGAYGFASNIVFIIVPLVPNPTISLIECSSFTVEGVKKGKICTQKTNGKPITFPTNFILYQNQDIIAVSENEIAQTLTINDQTLNYLIVESFDMCDFSDDRVEARQGIFYEKLLTIVLPKVQLYTNNQLFDFLFNVDGKYAVAECVIAIEDSLGQTFLVGYDVPCVLQELELQTDVYNSNDNFYKIVFSSKSYSRLRKYQVV